MVRAFVSATDATAVASASHLAGPRVQEGSLMLRGIGGGKLVGAQRKILIGRAGTGQSLHIMYSGARTQDEEVLGRCLTARAQLAQSRG